ncbi:transporter substrate-binding domain-containing protein [Zoogloea sp.]|uniref:substrate-binding periplasmic protein n=1 Tax=Zoogloea sp. TaxID=49181 RepID=UPI0031FD9379
MGALLAALLASVAHAETLIVYGSDRYPPISYLKAGKAEGIIPRILQRLQAETGDTYDIRLMPWARVMRMASAGEGAAANISWNSERAEIYDYSVPLYLSEVVVVVRKGNAFPFETLQDLKGKLIGVGLGSSYGNAADEAIAKGLFAVDRDADQQSRMLKLLAGRVDAVFVSSGREGVRHMLESAPELKGRIDQFVVLPQAVSSNPLHLAYLKRAGKKPAIERLNKAFLRLKARGAFNDLLAGGPRWRTD